MVLTNVVFRPLAFKWGPERLLLETNYQLDLTCASKDDARLRAVLLAAVKSNHLAITSLTSQLLEPEDHLRITAELKAAARNDQVMEQLVGCLAAEIGVTSVSWHVETPLAIE